MLFFVKSTPFTKNANPLTYLQAEMERSPDTKTFLNELLNVFSSVPSNAH